MKEMKEMKNVIKFQRPQAVTSTLKGLPDELQEAARRLCKAFDFMKKTNFEMPPIQQDLLGLVNNTELKKFWNEVHDKFLKRQERSKPQLAEIAKRTRLMWLYEELLAVLAVKEFPQENFKAILNRRKLIAKKLRGALKAIETDEELTAFNLMKLRPGYGDPADILEHVRQSPLSLSEALRSLVDMLERGRPLSVTDSLPRARRFPAAGGKKRRQNFIEQTLFQIFKKELGSPSYRLISTALNVVLGIDRDEFEIKDRCRKRRLLV